MRYRSLAPVCVFALAVILFPAAASAQPSGGPYGPIARTYEVPVDAAHVYYVAPDGKADAPGLALDAPTTIEAAMEFFTGLKPELGNGYADFLMFPDTSHAVQLALGSEIAVNLVPPACQTPSGENYLGGYKLTFQQP